MLRKSKLLLAFMPFTLLSCGSAINAKSTTIQLTYSSFGGAYQNIAAQFEFADKYMFKESEKDQYKITGNFDIDTGSKIKKASFDTSNIEQCFLTFGGWLNQTVLGEDTKVYAYSGKCILKASNVKSGDWLKFDYNPKLEKNGNKVCEAKMTITFKIA